MSMPQTVSRSINATQPWSEEFRDRSELEDANVVRSGTPRLSASELRRRLLHITPGFLPFGLWVIPHTDPWGPILADTVLVITAVIVCSALLRFRRFARAGEANGRAAVLGYALPVLTTLGVSRGSEEVGVMTLGILAFGDGSATLSGLLFGGPSLPWNHRKTWAGLSAFWVIGGFMATILYWGEAHPGVSWETAACIAAPSALVAGLLETFPRRGNDNLVVGTTAAIMGVIMHRLMMG